LVEEELWTTIEAEVLDNAGDVYIAWLYANGLYGLNFSEVNDDVVG
jgi:hypothetical protein